MQLPAAVGKSLRLVLFSDIAVGMSFIIDGKQSKSLLIAIITIITITITITINHSSHEQPNKLHQ